MRLADPAHAGLALGRLAAEFGGELDDCVSDAVVTGVALDSRNVEQGDLFVALPGTRVDGMRFAAQAVDRGAVAVLAPHERSSRTAPSLSSKAPTTGAEPGEMARTGCDEVGGSLPTWAHPQAARVAGLVASRLAGDPSAKLLVCGVTGTNGKTSVAHLCAQLLVAAGIPAGVLGTTGHRLPDGTERAARHTTPDAPELQALLAQQLAAGARVVVMEVSSHAIDQERTAGVEFRVAVFTNLTPDHLDYHGDLEGYARVKARLFGQLRPGGAAVLNADDPEWERMAEAARAAGARVVKYGTGSEIDLAAARLRTRARGTDFVLSGMGYEETCLRCSLRGRFNVENALAATAAALLLGASPATCVVGLASASPPPGRMEPIPTGDRGFDVLVDFAHTPDALERAARSVREQLDQGADSPGGRLILVFGCGGDRDRTKRAPMGRIACEHADEVVITTDNSRSEDPAAIAREVSAECGETRAGTPPRVELDRRLAIRLAIDLARSGDVVLIAGKGHETTQSIQGVVTAFDDRVVAREALA